MIFLSFHRIRATHTNLTLCGVLLIIQSPLLILIGSSGTVKKSQEPELKDLMEYTGSVIPAKWQEVGILLNDAAGNYIQYIRYNIYNIMSIPHTYSL